VAAERTWAANGARLAEVYREVEARWASDAARGARSAAR
jgi:hypothetical protein